MGCGASKGGAKPVNAAPPQAQLSANIIAVIEKSFKKIDVDGSGEVEIDEAVKVFKR